MSTSHQSLVDRQFGPRARAYVESTDHAVGADLAHIAALAGAREGGRFLDLGCGGGHVSFAMAPHAREVVAYDLSTTMLDAVRTEAAARDLAAIRVEQGRAERLPFAEAGFDLVCTRFSAHHWSDVPAALAEMRRVVKPTGLVVIADVVSPGPPLPDTFLQAMELLRDPSHVRDYTIAEWLAMLRAAALAPRPPRPGVLALDFSAWIARMETPAPMVAAIRTLQESMPAEVAARCDLRADGSFTLDTVLIEADPT